MSDWYTEQVLQILLIGLVIGLVLGFFMQRASRQRRPIRGGIGAEVFHYLASMTVSTMPITVLIAIISGLEFLQVFLIGVTILSSTWIFLLMYGIFESQAPAIESTEPQIELD